MKEVLLLSLGKIPFLASYDALRLTMKQQENKNYSSKEYERSLYVDMFAGKKCLTKRTGKKLTRSKLRKLKFLNIILEDPQYRKGGFVTIENINLLRVNEHIQKNLDTRIRDHKDSFDKYNSEHRNLLYAMHTKSSIDIAAYKKTISTIGLIFTPEYVKALVDEPNGYLKNTAFYLGKYVINQANQYVFT